VHSAADSADQVEALADAIVKIAVALSITDGTMPMTGPEVLSIASVALDEIQRLKIREVPAP
jgi:ABC-type branched-subunit amino acid transport system substrate-binding protein